MSVLVATNPTAQLSVTQETDTTLVVSTAQSVLLVATANQGPAGPQGPPGPPNSYLEFVQSNAAATWSINHNLARFPSVTIVDTSGDEIIGDIKYLDSNNVQLLFGTAITGTAYLN